jgi:hypothetical protein
MATGMAACGSTGSKSSSKSSSSSSVANKDKPLVGSTDSHPTQAQVLLTQTH